MKEDDHPDRICVWAYYQIQLPDRDFCHVDEICEQTYLDYLGHGINVEWKKGSKLKTV